MKSLWNSFKIAFSMFSKIPMPQAEWTKENMKYIAKPNSARDMGEFLISICNEK